MRRREAGSGAEWSKGTGCVNQPRNVLVVVVKFSVEARESADSFPTLEGNNLEHEMTMCSRHHRGSRAGHVSKGVARELVRSVGLLEQ